MCLYRGYLPSFGIFGYIFVLSPITGPAFEGIFDEELGSLYRSRGFDIWLADGVLVTLEEDEPS